MRHSGAGIESGPHWINKRRIRMKRLCYKCQTYKKDVTGYHFTSNEKSHTYIDVDMCIECRDKIIEVLTTNETISPALDK